MPAPANNQTSQDIKSEYLKKLKFHLGGSAEVEALKSSGSTEVEAPITEKVIITSQNQSYPITHPSYFLSFSPLPC